MNKGEINNKGEKKKQKMKQTSAIFLLTEAVFGVTIYVVFHTVFTQRIGVVEVSKRINDNIQFEIGINNSNN